MRIDQLAEVFRTANHDTRNDMLEAIEALIKHRGYVRFQGKDYYNVQTLKSSLDRFCSGQCSEGTPSPGDAMRYYHISGSSERLTA